jgi:hypothetical protein
MAKQNTDSDRCQDLKVETFKQGGFHKVSLRLTSGFIGFSVSLRIKNNTRPE